MRILALLPAISILAGFSAAAAAAPGAQITAEPPYRSPFNDYQAFKDEPVKDWRESNAAMQRLGGHMGHFNDASVSPDARPAGESRPADNKPTAGSKP